MKITIAKNGPYAVTGAVPLATQTIGANAAGDSVAWTQGESFAVGESYALCRCGKSSNKPFCDGSHAKVGFDGAELASREPFAAAAKAFDGPVLVLKDVEPLCAHARFCDRDGGVWRNVAQTRSAADRGAFERQVGQCPSGRIVAWDIAAGAAIEPELPASIVIVEDPQENISGPIWVRGGIEIVGSDGTAYEVRNRVTLCRCGQSKIKPFCDGTHHTIGFKA
jgi:CDGSH-type Zn-finger protein